MSTLTAIPAQLRSSIRRATSVRRAMIVEILVVAGVLLVIQIVMFAGYWNGSASPSGDFLASYSNEAFAWWRDGGILHPQDWVPYTWGGFPAAAQVQSPILSFIIIPHFFVGTFFPQSIAAGGAGRAAFTYFASRSVRWSY